MQLNDPPLLVASTDQLGPVGWRYVPSEVWGDQVLTQDPKAAQLAREYGRDVEALYTEAQLLAAVAAERKRYAEERLGSLNGLLLDLRQMADDSADRGDVFAQRVVRLLAGA